MYFYQPKDGKFGELFLKELRRGKYKHYKSLTVLVAYAKHSGAARIAEAIEAFRAAGGSAEFIVGINQQQTTIEALRLLATLGRVRVFFDENTNNTFHPKIYWLRSKNAQWIAVGSNNLTAGGFFSNYEMCVVSETDPTTGDGKSAKKFLTELVDEKLSPGHFIAINNASIKKLADEGYILSEAEVKELSKKTSTSVSTGSSTKKKAIFARSKNAALPQIPAKFQLKKKAGIVVPGTSTVPTSSATTSAPVSPGAIAGSGFWKRLTASDVSKTSSPGQMIIPREFLGFFPALSAPVTKASGGQQADAFFVAEFRNPPKKPVTVKGSRIISYTPAPNHPRKNIDVRFTFRNRSVLNALKKGDVLEFYPTSTSNPAMIVVRITKSKAKAKVNAADDYGIIP